MHDRVALITGAAKRLGANTAKHLHQLGYRVIIHYNNSQREAIALHQSLNTIRPDSAFLYQANLSQNSELAKLGDYIGAHFQQLDVLINNASSFYSTPLSSLSLEQYNDLISTNMTAPLFLTQHCEPYLTSAQGVVINMCDIHASRPLAHHTAYCMAKAGLKMMTFALANELAPNVRVNAVAPGAIEWPNHGIDSETVNEVLKSIPLQRKGHVDDIAQAIEYLISAPYVTGQILAIDGGRQHSASQGA